MELLLTRFYACRDADQICRSRYNFGITSVNALSKSFVIETTHSGMIWRQEFQHGVPLSPIMQTVESSVDFRQFTFVPDDGIVQNTKFSYPHFRNWLNEICGMIEGCSINFYNETNGESFDVAEIDR